MYYFQLSTIFFFFKVLQSYMALLSLFQQLMKHVSVIYWYSIFSATFFSHGFICTAVVLLCQARTAYFFFNGPSRRFHISSYTFTDFPCTLQLCFTYFQISSVFNASFYIMSIFTVHQCHWCVVAALQITATQKCIKDCILLTHRKLSTHLHCSLWPAVLSSHGRSSWLSLGPGHRHSWGHY